ncbi:esterase, partial [Gardnerella vaginalis]
MTNHNGVISDEFDNGEFDNNDNNGDFGSEDSAASASNGLHAGRESSVVPGRFGEDLHVNAAKYSRGEASAYATRPLLLLLHGWGSNEDDLLDLLRVVAPYNDAISLRAPLRLDQGAYSWFHDAVPQGDDLDRDMYAAAAAIDEWVAANVPEDRAVVPFGFSQGAALAVHILRLNPERYRAAVALSGFVA